LISETQWTQYCQDKLRNEDENDQTYINQVNEFNEVNTMDLEKDLKYKKIESSRNKCSLCGAFEIWNSKL
jgi:hypothetical protein